jgi:biotin transport system substrate-specific component
MSVVRTARGPQRVQLLIELVPRTALVTFAAIVGAAALTAVAAQLSFPVPGSPVPVTAQTLVVLVGAAALGPGRALVSQLLYIAAGAAGLPVFAGHSFGMNVLVGANGGYLVGFLLASLLIGATSRKGVDRNVIRELAAFIGGSIVVYVFGAGFLMVRFGMSLSTALSLGVVPFLIGDAVKVAIASGVLPTTWRLLGRAGR